MIVNEHVTIVMNRRPEFVIIGLDADEDGDGVLRCQTASIVPPERLLERLKSYVAELESSVRADDDGGDEEVSTA